MKYDVVIPSFYDKDKDYLNLCAKSLRESGFGGQIIVVTNGSISKPNLDFPCTHIHTRDQGQGIAVNIGSQLVSSEYILIANSDMYFAPGWIRQMEYVKNWPLVWSPNLIEPENNNGSADPFLKLDAGFTLDEFDKPKVDKFVGMRTGALAVSATDELGKEEPGFNFPVFIKRDFWQFLKGYDPVYDPWGSNGDTDLQTRINLAGVTPMRIRDVLVYHFSNKSGTFDGTHQQEYQHNIEYFKEKFGFDRDELKSDVWYNKDMIPDDKSKIKYEQKIYE